MESRSGEGQTTELRGFDSRRIGALLKLSGRGVVKAMEKVEGSAGVQRLGGGAGHAISLIDRKEI